MNQEEIWDLYTMNKQISGMHHIRGNGPIPPGYYHLVVHVWIINSKGEYLISQRAANRPTYPMKWECVGGSVIKGETSLQAAIRETKEEVGIDLSPTDAKLIFTKIRDEIDGKIFRDIMDVYIFHYDGAADLQNATTDEVAQIKWMTIEEIQELYKNNELVPTLNYFFTQILTMNNS